MTCLSVLDTRWTESAHVLTPPHFGFASFIRYVIFAAMLRSSFPSGPDKSHLVVHEMLRNTWRLLMAFPYPVAGDCRRLFTQKLKRSV